MQNTPAAPAAQISDAPTARREALAEATHLWDSGHRVSSLELLRRTRATLGNNASILIEYGAQAFLQGHVWAAREALHDAVDADPAHLDALELFQDINRDLPSAKGAATQPLMTLAESLPLGADRDAEAAAFLVPSVALVDAVNRGIRTLKRSEDPVARQISLLSTTPLERWDELEEEVSGDIAVRARLVLDLTLGNVDAAAVTLEEVADDGVPRRSVRQAIRQAQRLGNHELARELLVHYRRSESHTPQLSSAVRDALEFHLDQ
ncbi:hypothetical protein [Citricoccus sp. NR2]|uniref:hypothetical protein n=1 Tax=Citricoccus sp. NR2 TaxID=3004095 RepID=UPI0022DD9AA4|nr:hypothetical protein [Citricoccus sp. NR2]WBL19796.1 hypothetical protein O1A05_03630 [Citricoccus sp. NR2]